MLENGIVIGAAEEWERQNAGTEEDAGMQMLDGSDRMVRAYVEECNLIPEIISGALGIQIPADAMATAVAMVQEALDADSPIAFDICRTWIDRHDRTGWEDFLEERRRTA